MSGFSPITEVQWERLKGWFPQPLKRGRGKPPTSFRKVLNSILYIHFTGSKWEFIPRGEEWSSKSAAHRWMKIWQESGLLERVIEDVKKITSHDTSLLSG